VDVNNNHAQKVEPSQVVIPLAGGWLGAEMWKELRNKGNPSISAVKELLAHIHRIFHELRYVPAHVE
jgi:hypothetical protein